MVNSGWLDFSNLKVFVKFSDDEHGLNCGLDFCAEVCKTLLHYINRGLIFKWYENSDGGCSCFGRWNVLLVFYLGIYELLDKQIEQVPQVLKL